jgi:L,D-transpeptidase YbiS
MSPNNEQALGECQELVSVVVSSQLQQLYVFKDQQVLRTYKISTAKNGLGEQKNSYMTPRGKHIIRAKIGANLPINAIFKERRFYGDIYTAKMNEENPHRDWILTRILWLSGLEPGFNRLGNVDTMQRYIYIHGSPDERPMGQPTSRGCVRMRNEDIIEFFDLVSHGTRVNIE